MFSMGATDALANRGRTRTTSNSNTAQQRNQQRNRTRTRVRTPQRQRSNSSAVSARAQQQIQFSKIMLSQSISQNATPPFLLVPNKDSVTMTQTRGAHYKNGITAAHSVSGLPASGELNLTGLLPVSAHTGQAQQFAKSNVYNVIITHADGTTQNLGKIKSTGLVTEHGMKLNLKPGKTIVQFWPDGSGGVGGYKAGREIELNWSGN